MELDDNTPQTQTISDEQRRLAEAKKVTLQPIHTNIAPEATSGAEIASRHLIDPAIGNISNDIEQTAPLVKPSRGQLERTDIVPHARLPHILSIIGVSLIAIGIVILLFILMNHSKTLTL